MNQQHGSPIVADLALARRLERAEALANAEFVDAGKAAFADSSNAWIEVAGAYAMFDGVESPCTQTFGLGVFEPITHGHLAEIEAFFQQRGAPVYHEVCPIAEPSLVELLNERGYQPLEYSSVLFRSLNDLAGGPPELENSLKVRRIEPVENNLWARTAAEGWKDVAPGLEEYIEGLARINPHRPNGHSFLVERQGEPIAAGALNVANGVALLAGACTIPRFRRHGAQRALLAHRLRFAAERGCDLAMIVAAPGSGSQRNAEREGFRIAYTRTKWRLAKPRNQ